MRLRFLCLVPILAGLGALLWFQPRATTQDTPPSAPDNYEVLARGPVHEAYAGPVDFTPEPGPVADKAPPEPIDELPPDQKPEGDDVEWITGYWSWDEEGKNYLWVSGFWRDMPPGRRWVPGTWQEAADGWHWTPGFWAAEDQQTIDYVPPPPQGIDAGPSTPAVRETDTYVPGTWIWRETRFFWRPGFWVEYQPDWVWCPAHYVWTPGGCVFVEGYWDHPLHMRGLLFAPIRPRLDVLAFTYRPAYVIQTDFLMTAMFVGPARRNYYFGDYFEPAYERRGFVAWINYQPSRRAVDPTFAYYRSAYHAQPTWHENLTALYAGRRTGDIARPPRTLVQQNTVINNITNNKTTNVNVTKNVNITNVQNVTVIQPITQVNKTESTALASLAPTAAKETRPAAPRRVVNLTKINNTQVNQIKENVTQERTLSKQRQQTEAKLLADPATAATGTTERPRAATRLELPKPTARAGTPPAAKKGEAGTPPTAPRAKPAPPAPPALPRQVERETPKPDGQPPRAVRPPAARTGQPPVPGKKDTDPPAKGTTPRPTPKKDKDDDPTPPAKKAPTPLPKMKDEPPPAPPKKLEPPPAPPKKADPPPAPPKKADPPGKKDKDEPPKSPPKKKDDGKD
jgi:hypothetical protein